MRCSSDRCRIIQFPEPRQENPPMLSRQIMSDMLAVQGLDQRCPPPPLNEAEGKDYLRSMAGKIGTRIGAID